MSTFTTEADIVLEKIVAIAKADVDAIQAGDEMKRSRSDVMSLCDWGGLMSTISKHQRAAGGKDAAGASLDDLKGNMMDNPIVAKMLGLPEGMTLGDLIEAFKRTAPR